jgi:succinyl-CoA synthetase alpha subunit
MNLHEIRAKHLLASGGVPVPAAAHAISAPRLGFRVTVYVGDPLFAGGLRIVDRPAAAVKEAGATAAPIGSATRVAGPNSQWILVIVLVTGAVRQERIGMASRSESLTSKIGAQANVAALGDSTGVCVNGDPCMPHAWPTRKLMVILIGEIGGTEEPEVANLVGECKSTTSIVALLAGRCAPQRQRIGEPGVLTTLGRGDAKIAALEKAWGMVAAYVDDVAGAMLRVLH